MREGGKVKERKEGEGRKVREERKVKEGEDILPSIIYFRP